MRVWAAIPQETLQEIARLERTVQDQKGRIAILQPALATAETHVAVHRAQVCQLEARIAELEAELEEARLHNVQRTEECGRLQGELAVYAALAPSEQGKKSGRLRLPRPDLHSPTQARLRPLTIRDRVV